MRLGTLPCGNEVDWLTQTILWGKEEDISALLNITPVDEHTLQGTPLTAAASVGRPDIVWRLLERGFNPNATTEIDNQTALYQAAERGHIQVVELLSLKTEKDIFTWSTWTPLHVAAISGHALIVKCLLNAEFNQNAQTNAKMTALAYAAQQGHLGVMKVLLEWGVVDPPDGRGYHALDHAVVRCEGKNNEETLRLLRDAGFQKMKPWCQLLEKVNRFNHWTIGPFDRMILRAIR